MTRADKDSKQKISPAEEIWPGAPVELLKALHLLTRDGLMNADSRRKAKQVRHFVELLKPAVTDLLARHAEPVLVDCGAGKTYLGMLLAHALLVPEARGQVLALESRPDVVNTAQTIAKQAGLNERVAWQTGSIEQATLPERIHLVMALHACDTATDDALLLGIKRQADHIAVVPCCQAEVAELLRKAKPSSPAWSELYAHGWHRREYAAHLTNVIRALTLEAYGYTVTVTELVGLEHSMKNELILARRVHGSNAAARRRLKELLTATGVSPKLTRVLLGAADHNAPESPENPTAA